MSMAVFEVVINFYQGFLLIYFMAKHFHLEKHSILWEIGAITLIGGGLSGLQYSSLPISEDLLFIIPFFYALWATNEKWSTCLLWTVILMICFLGMITLIGTVFSVVTGSNWAVWQNIPTIHITFVVSTNIALTLIITVVSQLGKKQPYISAKASVVILLVLVCCFACNESIYLLQIRENSELYSSIAVISVLFIAILSITLYEMMNYDAEKKRSMELSLQSASLVEQHQGELRSMYSSMLAVQHDLRHRITLAEELLKRSELTTENQEQVKKLLDSPELYDPYITGNLAMDALLKAKVSVMQQCGIMFDYTPYPLNKPPIPEQDFCVMMSNILDNAIEGVMRIPASSMERKIHLKIEKPWDMMAITCTNSADPNSVHAEGGRWISTKAHRDLHGFGTESIRKTVEHYNGNVRYRVHGWSFSISILLPMEK